MGVWGGGWWVITFFGVHIPYGEINRHCTVLRHSSSKLDIWVWPQPNDMVNHTLLLIQFIYSGIFC